MTKEQISIDAGNKMINLSRVNSKVTKQRRNPAIKPIVYLFDFSILKCFDHKRFVFLIQPLGII